MARFQSSNYLSPTLTFERLPSSVRLQKKDGVLSPLQAFLFASILIRNAGEGEQHSLSFTWLEFTNAAFEFAARIC